MFYVEGNKTVGIDSRSYDSNRCLTTFPFNCKLPPQAITIQYLQPDINIPYCHR